MSAGEHESGAGRPSGLRNPPAAVRGIGAAALGVQGLVLLLAIVPLRVLGSDSAGATAAVVLLALVSLVLAALLRWRWAWWAGSATPLAIIGCGFAVHPSLVVLGTIFGLVWLYVLKVRRDVLGGRQS